MSELTKEYFDEMLKSLATKQDLIRIDQRFESIDARFESVDQRFEGIMTFLETQVALKSDVEALRIDLPTRQDFNELQRSVDGLANRYKHHDDELTVLTAKTTDIQEWISAAAPKVGVKFKKSNS